MLRKRVGKAGRATRAACAATIALGITLSVGSSAFAAGPWTQQQKLTAGDSAAGNEFGIPAISADGNTVLVGAPGTKDIAPGAAYIFTRSGGVWTQQAELTDPDAASCDNFGASVALSGDGTIALIGVAHEGCTPGSPGSDPGAAYVFALSGGVWTLQHKFTPPAGPGSFGDAVALNGDGTTALISADDNTSFPSAVYVYTRSGSSWTQQAALTPSVISTGDLFGRSVSLSSLGNTALVGDHNFSTTPGSAYVFTRSSSTWSQQQRLTAGDGAAGDAFGLDVSLSGDGGTSVIGAAGKNSFHGVAYVFTLSSSTWTQQQELTAMDGAAHD